MFKYIILFLCLLSGYAVAHEERASFIPSMCCSTDGSDPDCKPIVPKSVRHVNGYYYIIDIATTEIKYKIPEEEASPSEDGQYWLCTRPNGEVRFAPKVCFFAPKEGS